MDNRLPTPLTGNTLMVNVLSGDKRAQRLDPITSLRFFAAAMIVVGHAHAISGSWGIATAIPLEQGVSFFFVLSGFILTWNYPVLREWPAIRRFWRARFARIWPLHAFTCFMWIALLYRPDLQTPSAAGKEAAKLILNLGLLHAWLPFSVLSFNFVSWSLSEEFFFYAMFPFLIARWRKHWALLIGSSLAVVIAFILIVHFLGFAASETKIMGLLYFNPLVRIFEFVVGIATAGIIRHISGRIHLTATQWTMLETATLATIIAVLLGLYALPGAITALSPAAAYYVVHEGISVLWAVLIGVFAVSTGLIAKILSRRLFVLLGEASFALYLCHAMIINYVQVNHLQIAGVPGYLLLWGVCLSVSFALFYGIEQPARQWLLNVGQKDPADERKERRPGPNFTIWTANIFLAVFIIAAVSHRTF
ncbi:MAG: acyltransferase [Nitrospiraceae bacterium]|nr:acyltransferase [Nitrospiraceae bacterium]